MSLRESQDSARDLLETLEEGWGSLEAAPGEAPAPAPPTANGALRMDDVPAPSTSTPDLASLDDGWLDDLFPGGDADDDDEPDLPDERLDPEAFARAKAARDERAAKKKERRRAKAEARRARQRARADATRQKQKAKKGRVTSAPLRAATPSSTRRPESGSHMRAPREETARDDAALTSKPRPRTRAPAPRRAPSTLASVKLLAVVLGTLLALAAAIAAIVK